MLTENLSKISQPKRRAIIRIALVGVCLCAFMLRVWGLERTSMTNTDEALFALEANSFSKMPALVFSFLRDRPLDAQSGREFIRKHFPEGFLPTVSAKPGFIFPAVAAIWVSPEAYEEFAILLLSVLAGTLAVFAAYLLTKELTGSDIAGVGAALLLAFSPYHIFYSRLAFPQALAAACVAFGAWAYCRSFRADHKTVFRWLFAAGFLLGYAFTTHYNVTPLAALWLSFEAVFALKKQRVDLWGRLGVFAAGFAMPPIFWQVVLWFKGLVMSAYGSLGFHQSYFAEYWSIVGGYAPPPTLRGADFYLEMLRYLDGPFFALTAVAVCAAWFSLRGTRKAPHAFLWCMVVGFFCLYSVIALRATRTMVIILPLLASLIAIGAYRIFGLLRNRTGQLAAFCAIVAVIAVSHTGVIRTILQLKSGYAEAAEAFFELPGNTVPVGSPWAVFQWKARSRVYSTDDKPLRTGEGTYFIADGLTIQYPEDYAYAKTHTPILTFKNPMLAFYPYARDFLVTWSGEEVKNLLKTDQGFGEIRIYKL